MPWKTEDAEKHMKGLSKDMMGKWAEIANSAMKSCLADGRKDCDGYAIRVANSRVNMMTNKESKDISFVTPILETQLVNKEKGIYEITLLKEGETQDKKRFYPRSTLEKAIPIFEGTQAFADHPTKFEMKDRPERSIRDLIGIYENVRLENGNDGVARLKANLKVLESASWVKSIFNMAIENPKLCGSSIHADGRIVPQGKNNAELVESIDEVFSTDIVTKPNAGGKIERLIASNRKIERGDNDMDLKELTLEQLKEGRSDLLEGFKKELLEELNAKTEDKTTEDKTLSESYKKLADSHEALIIRMKITESKLLESIKDSKDREVVEKELTESLKGKTEEDMDKVIEARKVFLKGLGVKISGNPAKEDQQKAGYHVGTILSEAKQAWKNLYE